MHCEKYALDICQNFGLLLLLYYFPTVRVCRLENSVLARPNDADADVAHFTCIHRTALTALRLLTYGALSMEWRSPWSSSYTCHNGRIHPQSQSRLNLSLSFSLSLKALLLLLLSLSNLATQSPSLSHSCRTHARGREGES